MFEENNNAKMSEAKSETEKLSKDACGLGPMQAGPFVIGLVDSIVGKDGAEMPQFVATKYELLVKHWATGSI
jgi:hypothetical protein